MTSEEWESLCDGCALCCLYKLEDEDTHEIFYTSVACKLLDLGTCRCMSYENRFNLIEDCLKIEPVGFDRMKILPESCAYRRISDGKSLPSWHPLITRNSESVHEACISVRHKAVSEENVHPDDIHDSVLFKVE